MGTRGFVGFVVDGVEKFVVTHGDSYPSGVGVGVLEWLAGHQDELVFGAPGGVVDRVRALRFVSPSVDPDVDPPGLGRVRDALRGGPHEYFADASVEEVLDFAAYDLDTLLRGGLAFDGNSFPLDSLYCEWGYLVDLDTRAFEVYRGFQTTPPTSGRFVGRPPVSDPYFPVALVASWPLVALPDRDRLLAIPDAHQ
jgi:hypothetical protein